jgi:GTP-binding protein
MLPVVAIVGRPNVGKSSLLNALLGRRYAIVDDMPGVTRDRIAAPAELLPGRWVELVDTGGIGIVDKQALEEHVEAQIQQALAICDVIVLVTDAHEGCTPIDREIARALRAREAPILLVVNKTESRAAQAAVPEFAELGFEPLALSALEGHGLDELRQRILAALAEEGGAGGPPPEPVLKVAILGRVNVGKSTFLNVLAGEERAIVSELPGTTRDTVDVRIEKEGRTFLVMDTAGLKREKAVQDSVEFYAQRRAEQAIERAEVCLLLLDCTEEITRGDRKIARMIEDAVRPVVIVANKWDLAKGKMEMEQYASYLAQKLPGLHFAPLAFVSAKEGRNVLGALETAESLAKQARLRVGTAEINRAVERAMTRSRPPTRIPREPKIYYGTQTGVSPPTIMLFVNDPRLFGPAFRRFLENRFREELPFKEIPLRIVYKRRQSIFARKES